MHQSFPYALLTFSPSITTNALKGPQERLKVTGCFAIWSEQEGEAEIHDLMESSTTTLHGQVFQADQYLVQCLVEKSKTHTKQTARFPHLRTGEISFILNLKGRKIIP